MQCVHPLTAFRQRQNLSRARLADLLDVDKATVWRWETGARRVDTDKLAVISEKTGIAPAELRPDLAELMQSNEAAQ